LGEEDRFVKALLVIDAQRNLLEEPTPVHDAPTILDRLAVLLSGARASATPVVFVQHCGAAGDVDEAGTPGWEIHPRCRPDAGEPVVQKTRPDAFEGTDLEEILTTRGIRGVIVAGLQSEFCVRATCRGALERGYEVTLIGDTHSTYDARTSTASETIDQINAELAPSLAITTAAAVRFA
jgi:nicotinamidase-related amidase